jgi:hypothetical protein
VVTQRRGDPQQAQALLALAMNAVAAGNASAALDFLQRARASGSGNPATNRARWPRWTARWRWRPVTPRS